MAKALADVEGVVVHETEKAYLFDYGGGDPVWLPKSMCEWDADTQIMTMEQSFAEHKGVV